MVHPTFMDPIRDALAAIREGSASYQRLDGFAAWESSSETGKQARFGMVSRGVAWLSLDGNGPIRLAEGDGFLLSPGTGHQLRRDAGESATIIGGRLTFDEPSGKTLADLLPPVIHIRADQERSATLRTTLELLAAETAEPAMGSQTMIERLAGIIFIHAIRAHAAAREPDAAGWRPAPADPQIGAVLKAMHEQVEYPWTVRALATQAGMSRSAFALRFKELIGQAPLEYLTRCRMYKAGRLLREDGRKLFEVAASVGYESGGAFHKAFKRVLGMTPGEYRRGVNRGAAVNFENSSRQGPLARPLGYSIAATGNHSA
jgi:AraC-like DNA-binding protein